MWRYVAPCRGPEISGGPRAAFPVERLPGLLRCLRIVSHWAGFFFREPGRLPGAGARIRAGKGSVRAPGVPVPVTVYVLVQVARYGAVAVPHALSHRDTPAILATSARVSIGANAFGEFSKSKTPLCPQA